MDVIHKSVVLGVVAGVEIEPFNKAMGMGDSNRNIAQTFCLVRLFHLLLKRRDLYPQHANITVICDSGNSSQTMLTAYNKLKKSERELNLGLSCIGFADDRFYLPLQAADMLACLVIHQERRVQGQQQPVYGSSENLFEEALKKNDLPYEPERWGQEDIDRHAGDIRSGILGLIR